MPTPRARTFHGPAILMHGFRPFFLLGALYAGLSIVLWLPQFYGELALATRFAPVDWHIHEMFFGFLAAVITGFLFTAVPNWTGRMPIVGMPLLVLALLWLAGRIAVTFSAYIDWVAVMIVDISFLTAVLVSIGIEVAAGRNWRNLIVLLPLGLFLAANIAFHLEAQNDGISDMSRRAAMTAAIILITIIGGRIIPSFTRNWLSKQDSPGLPVPFNRFDAITIAFGIAALASWTVAPARSETGLLLGLAAILHAVRLARWSGIRTLREPMLCILHVGYIFVPLGFALLSLGIFWPDTVPPVTGTHAFGAGAIGIMTIAVMIRATLGHSGREVTAGLAAKLIFAALIVSVTARLVAAMNFDAAETVLHISAFGWLFAFVGFAICYAPALTGRSHR